jgi:hypothetical protein
VRHGNGHGASDLTDRQLFSAGRRRHDHDAPGEGQYGVTGGPKGRLFGSPFSTVLDSGLTGCRAARLGDDRLVSRIPHTLTAMR